MGTISDDRIYGSHRSEEGSSTGYMQIRAIKQYQWNFTVKEKYEHEDFAGGPRISVSRGSEDRLES